MIMVSFSKRGSTSHKYDMYEHIICTTKNHLHFHWTFFVLIIYTFFCNLLNTLRGGGNSKHFTYFVKGYVLLSSLDLQPTTENHIIIILCFIYLTDITVNIHKI